MTRPEEARPEEAGPSANRSGSGPTASRPRPDEARPSRSQAAGARGGGRLRILGGEYRGRRLTVAAGVRPTEARLREALFSIWSNRLKGCRFLDLFAGSGAVGLEALSRGARRVVLVEQAPKVLAVLRRNLAEIASAATDGVSLALRGDVRRWNLPATGRAGRGPVAPGERYDLIFADPPYRFVRHEELLIAAAPWLAPGGEMAIEHSRRVELSPSVGPWLLRDLRCYGDSCFGFYAFDTTPLSDRPRT